MTPEQVLKEFRKAGALLDGHFLLSSVCTVAIICNVQKC